MMFHIGWRGEQNTLKVMLERESKKKKQYLLVDEAVADGDSQENGQKLAHDAVLLIFIFILKFFPSGLVDYDGRAFWELSKQFLNKRLTMIKV